MKIIVISDSHGDAATFDKLVKMQTNSEVVIFLGDGCEEFDHIKHSYPDKMFIGVRGNNDWCSPLPLTDEIVIEGKRIFMTHGHTYGVKGGLSRLIAEGKKRTADIVLFGHTHIPYTSYEDGMYVMNPGSLRRFQCSYGVIEIKNGDILLNTAVFKQR